MSSVRPSVWLSVMWVDCDHIGWKAWKLIARTISPDPSLFVVQTPSTNSQWNMGKFWGDYRGVAEKSGVLEHKIGKSLWRAYRNSPTLFRTVPSQTTYGLFFSKIGGSQTPIAIKLQTSNLAGTFTGSMWIKALYKFGRLRDERRRIQRLSKFFGYPNYLRTSNLAGTFTGSIRTKAH